MTAYSEIKAVNFSTLKHMESGPLHYIAALGRKFKQTAAMAKGSLIHCMALEPSQVDARYCINDWSRNSNKYKELAAMEKDAGRIVIKQKDYDEAKVVATSILGHPDAEMLLDGAEMEKTLTWKMDGVQCKGRLDAAKVKGRPTIIDLKTTVDPQPWRFAKQVYDMKYHAQMAFYANGLVETYHCDYPNVYLIAVGNTAPYECIVYKLPLPVMDAGEQLINKWMAELRECREADSFRSRFGGVQELKLPSWAYGHDKEVDDTVSIGGSNFKLNEETGILEVIE